MNKYLEIDSSFRNRNLYPIPSNFVVEISQSGQKNAMSALDPVSNASPIKVWNNSFTEATWGSNIITNITVSPASSPSTDGNTTFQITSQTGSQQLRQVNGFYNGACLISGTGGTFPPVPPLTCRRIIDYEYINLYNAFITVDSAIPDNLVGLVGYWEIANPTPIPTNSTGSVINFFIPNGVASDNYYIGYLIQNIMTSEYKTITAYDGTIRLAVLDSPTLTDWLNIPISGSTGSAANFVIRKEIPVATGTIADYFQSSVQLQSSASNISDIYSGSFLRIVQTNYTGPNSTGPYSSPLSPYNQEIRINKYIAGDGLISSVNGNIVTLNPTTSSSTDNYYVGGILTDSTKSTGALVTGYVGSTHQATLYSSIGASIGDAWTMRTAVLQQQFTASPYLSATGLLNKNYEVEMFSRDNANPFVYNGSLVTTEQMVCYEVELLNLTLPNTVLASGRGGRAIFYPYLYVELQQVSAAGNNNNILYSNNPNSHKMLFRAVVDDTPIPVISPFIKIDGDGMTHTIKFKPTDSFRFSVHHPNNGELFRTVIQDYYSPTEVNPLAQISACFAFRRKDMA